MFLSLFVKKMYFCLFDLEIDILTSKMTLSHKNNTINRSPSQNHTCNWLHLLKNHI